MAPHPKEPVSGDNHDTKHGDDQTGASSVETRPVSRTDDAVDGDSYDWVRREDAPPARVDPGDDKQDAYSRRLGTEPPIVIPVSHAENSSSDQESGDASDHPDLSNAKIMAVLAHMSVMFGLPFFLLPLWTRGDRLSLHHARTAGAIYVYFYGLLALSTVSCGIFFPLAMLGYLPALVAIYRAIQSKSAGKWGFGQFGEWLFGWIRMPDDD